MYHDVQLDELEGGCDIKHVMRIDTKFARA